MTTKTTDVFLSLEEAATAAAQSTGLVVTNQDIKDLVDWEVLVNFGSTASPRILKDHATLLAGRLGTPLELATASLQRKQLPPNNHLLLVLSRHLAVSFDPARVQGVSLRAFIYALRERSRRSFSSDDWSHTMTPLEQGLYVWADDDSKACQWQSDWAVAASTVENTTMAEALCVPMLYGNKGRLTAFLLTAVRQHLDRGMPICDLMAGTGLVTRQLLAHYHVHANDAALFAATLAASQAISIDEKRATLLRDQIRIAYEHNYRSLKDLFGQALNREEEFLLGGLSQGRLAEYREFASTCTRFVPEYNALRGSSTWTEDQDAPVRSRVIAAITQRRQRPEMIPFSLTTAYWGNCYFGLRQAAEIDSLRYAITTITPDSDRLLLSAILIAAADGCASGPHYAQPPVSKDDHQLRMLIDKRAKSVVSEFEDRLWIACRRPLVDQEKLSVTNLPWREALDQFRCFHSGSKSRGVYVDPPYTRLQYSRFYHVLETLLRYDYPSCEGKGRVSEKAKRFSSRFDSREPSVIAEFRSLFQHVRNIGATLFLSYSSIGTLSLDRLLRLAREHFPHVSVYATPLQHHSQGVKLRDRGHQVELLIVGRE